MKNLFKRTKLPAFKIWLYADMEGINNVTVWDEVNPACENYPKGQTLMTAEVNAAVKGFLKGGAQSIFINDLHWFYNNILWEKMDAGAVNCSGADLNIPGFFSKYFDAVAIVGMHAKAGQQNAILPHSWYLPSYIESLKYDQEFIGEIALIKLLADEKGVPVIFLSGDKAGCLEAQENVPAVVTAMTKEKNGEKIICLSQKKANKLVCRKAKESVRLLTESKKDPILQSMPLESTFATEELSDMIELRCQSKKIEHKRFSGKTIVFSGNIFSEILSNFFAVLD